MLAACAAQQPQVSPPAAAAVSAPADLAGTRWKGATEANVNPNATPWIEFARERVSGFTGCNLFNGAWRMEAGEPRVGPVVMTKRGCMGPEGDLERRVLAVLNEQGRFKLEGGKLVATGPRGERYEFTPAASAPR
jgi:copper homeostasis protein (lipoprotein)